MKFDVKDFQSRFPEMKPFIGSDYERAKEKGCALLVIGESHYLPNSSTIHKDCDVWYAANDSLLTQEEKGWINTSELINDDIINKRFQKEHSIWKNGYQQINKYGPMLPDYIDCFEYTIFYNFYLRPANKGNSIKELRKHDDDVISNEYFDWMVKTYSPNGILFFSRFAYDNCWAKNDLHIPVVATPHPGCRWWNRKSGKYGGRYGRDIVEDVMKGMNWNWVHQCH